MSFLKKLFGGGEAKSEGPKGDAVLGEESLQGLHHQGDRDAGW
ncbi:hypothetical protein PSQ19_08200 [Devosia algicola]|uniref:Uncharacterized protein n=1 Tax=Devosia algicola TaxID=3026418 RepID=A0ABY7YRN4_9HYPH|nr:hypothetical protein PSQ19_08200 [Devosia algicola]